MAALLPLRLLASLAPKIGLAKRAASIRCEIFSLVVGHAALRLFSLSCPKTLGALCCAQLRHPVSACPSKAVRLCALSCGSLPSLLGSDCPLVWPQKSSCGLPLAAANLVGHSWWVTVSPWCASFSLNLVGLLSRSGGLSFTSLGLWCCLWGAVLFLGTFGFWGFNILCFPCVGCFGRVLFWGGVFLAWHGTCICGLHIEFL